MWMSKAKDGRRISVLSPEHQSPEATRAVAVPVLAFPLIYLWWQIEPALNYLATLRSASRSERIAAFLKRAKDLGMRRKPGDQLVPRLPGGRSGAGEGDIPR